MANVHVRLGNKSSAWFTANPTHVLEDGQLVYVNDQSGLYKKGDGVTELSDLTFLGGAVAQTLLLTGGVISVGTYGGAGLLNDIRVTASTFFIAGQGSFSAAQTDFLDIALSTAGNQRFIGLYGTILDTIIKVEGAEAALASFPAQPADTCLIGYVLVGDANLGSTPDLSGYLLKSSKATAADIITGTEDAKYITPLGLRNAGPTITSVASSATPTPVVSIDITNTDVLQITALAAGATIAAPTGVATNHKKLIIRIKDNGIARALAFNAIYRFSTDLAAPTTTAISKTMYLGFVYNSADTKWDCVAILNNL